MGYAILAGVDPVVGIYTAFFPVLVYVIMGTMPHVSMGTFAVVSILASKEEFLLLLTETMMLEF
jgi:MFS superfamily sulfate permease-like transporter